MAITIYSSEKRDMIYNGTLFGKKNTILPYYCMNETQNQLAE